MLVSQFEKYLTDVCLYIFVIRGVELYNVSFSVLFPCSLGIEC